MEQKQYYSKLLQASSIGIGTYLGSEDDRTDELYYQSILEAVNLGCNVIDNAINYRHMKSERVVGRVMQKLAKEHPESREKLIIATKGGFIPFDCESGEKPHDYIYDTFMRTGILSESHIVEGCHSLHPVFIQECVKMSLKNLGVDYIDIYYLHNPETQLSEVNAHEFYRRLSLAFEVLEGFVKVGRIRMYGTATWDGYRLNADEPERLSLKRVIQAAESTTAGKNHHCKVIQMPVNVCMPEAALIQNQELNGGWGSALETAKDLGLFVTTSATLLQTQALKEKGLLSVSELDNLGPSVSRRAIQVIRSLRGVTTSLVGMKNIKHVQENLQLFRFPKLNQDIAHKIITEFL